MARARVSRHIAKGKTIAGNVALRKKGRRAIHRHIGHKPRNIRVVNAPKHIW
jgi:hypothetical protein